MIEASLSTIEVFDMPKPSDLLQGTLDLLILKTIAREPLHGWGIAKRIVALSGDVLAVGQGSLYPALHRLEQQGWIRADWKESDLGRSAKFYGLTRDGKRQLERELASWSRLSSAVSLLIQNA
jgi:transcriptional regulator